MNFELRPGKYIIAVSGGVDSVVLLNMLSKRRDLELIVAHFDHQIRVNSELTRSFVSKEAGKLKLPFVSEKGNLGLRASEAQARQARYKFLFKIMKQTNSNAVITAHHQDDLLETMLINLIRGTGRKGLSSLRSTNKVIRPLLSYSKKQIIAYAKQHGLAWREDPSNADLKYLRNYIRLKIVPKLSKQDKIKLIGISGKAKAKNRQIDTLLFKLIGGGNSISREIFTKLDYSLAKEVMAEFLRQNNIALDERKVNVLSIAAKAALPGKSIALDKTSKLQVGLSEIKIVKTN